MSSGGFWGAASLGMTPGAGPGWRELLAPELRGLGRALSLFAQRGRSCKKPIASEGNRSQLDKGAVEKQIRYCSTREHKANWE